MSIASNKAFCSLHFSNFSMYCEYISEGVSEGNASNESLQHMLLQRNKVYLCYVTGIMLILRYYNLR